MEQMKIYELPLQAAVAKRCECLAQFYYKSGYKKASTLAAKQQVLDELSNCMRMIKDSPNGMLPRFREIHYESPILPSESDLRCPSCGLNDLVKNGTKTLHGIPTQMYKCNHCGRSFVPKD